MYVFVPLSVKVIVGTLERAVFPSYQVPFEKMAGVLKVTVCAFPLVTSIL